MRSNELRLRLRVFVGLACGVACLATSSLKSQGFEAILWRHGGPRLDAAIAERLRASGVTAVSVDQDEDPAAMRALGLRFYLDHAAGKGTLHLRKKTFEAARKVWLDERDANPLRVLCRPRPLLDEVVLARASGLVDARARRAAKAGALMISLDDEISTTSFTAPIDWCFAPSSLASFRRLLAARYGDLDGLAASWGMRFKSWDQVLPPTTDQVRQEAFLTDWPRNLCAWNDHREFMDIELARALRRLAQSARVAAPGLPVGFEGGQPPAAFGGYDWSRLLPIVDWVEPYNLGGLRELVRSWKTPSQLHFETIFPEKDATLAPRAISKLWAAYAHGLSGVILWSAGKFLDAKGQLTGFGRLLAPELRKLADPRARLLVGARPYPGDVVVLESQPSVRLHWMLDSRGDAETWPARLSSYERENSTSYATRHSWVRLLQDLGYPFRFVRPADLSKERMGGTRSPKVLVLPSTLALSDRDCARVRAFAKAGGLVLADETPARYDERLRLRDRPRLDDFFGLRRVRAQRRLSGGKLFSSSLRLPTGVGVCETGLAPEGVTVARLATAPEKRADARGLEAIGDARDGASWCQFERSVGRGRACLLNLAVFEYAKQRLRPEYALRCRDLRRRLRALFDAAGVSELCLVRIEGYPTILERQIFEKDGRQMLVIRANCHEDPDLFRTLAARGPQKMTIVLPMAARLRDLFTGEAVGRAGRRIEATLDPLRGAYFVLEAL